MFLQFISRRLPILVTVLFSFWFSPLYAEEIPTQNGAPLASLSSMLKTVTPAIVNIYVQGQMPPGRYAKPQPPAQPSPYQVPSVGAGPKFEDVGSGVVVDGKNGYIVTNAHVIRDAQTITVTLNNGRRIQARLIGVDAPSDVAIIKVNATNLTALPFADSDKVEVGDFVVAIGNPFGLLNQTVTSGVVSALNRGDLGIEGYENFIQTDAPINPGNSGGALVNMKGELIGINTAIIAPSGGSVGIGFAIPSNMAKGVMDQLIKYGKVERGLLGVLVQDVTPELADALNATGAKGAIVTQVNPGSPAAKAGIKVGDILIKVNGKSVNNASQLRNSVGLARVGTVLGIEAVRNGKVVTFTVTTAPAREAMGMASKPSFLAGARLRNFDELDYNASQVKGVEVMDIDNTSAAWLGGLRPGDVILVANNQPITNINQLLSIANSNPKRLLLQVLREGGTLFLVINND